MKSDADFKADYRVSRQTFNMLRHLIGSRLSGIHTKPTRYSTGTFRRLIVFDLGIIDFFTKNA
jgi:hypothetical protein